MGSAMAFGSPPATLLTAAAEVLELLRREAATHSFLQLLPATVDELVRGNGIGSR
jgi:hypothetical protein